MKPIHARLSGLSGLTKLKLALACGVLAASSACAAIVGLDKEYANCGASPCVDATPPPASADTSPPPPPEDAGKDVATVPDADADAEPACPGLADAASTGVDDAMIGFAIPSPTALASLLGRYDAGQDGGTAYDSVTGLTWQRFPTDTPGEGELTHAEATAYCQALRLDGHADWRLPTRGELLSLTDYRFGMPSLDQSIFPPILDEMTGGYVSRGSFWTSTLVAGNPLSAWIVGTDDGYFTISERECPKAAGGCFHARCVR